MTALIVLALHMLGDFVTQTDDMAKLKFLDWKVRTVHVFLYTGPFYVLGINAGWPLWVPFAIFAAHWITDCRRWASGDKWPPKPIMVDQTLHILQLAIILSVAGVK